MRLLIVLSIASFFRVCGSEPEAPPPPATSVTVESPPPGTAPVTVDTPPPPAVGAAVVGSAEVRFVQAGPREVRLYGLHGGRRLPASQLRVRRARILTADGPRVIVLEPRDDYYVAVTPWDLPPQPRFDVEVGFIADPTPPAVVVVNGYAPRASVEVSAWVPGPPDVHVVAPAPPSVHIVAPPPPSVRVIAPGPPAVRVRGGVHVDARVIAPAPPAVHIVAPRPPSISVGIGVPSPRVVVVGEARGDGHGHRGRGVGHIRARGRGHHRH